MNIQVIKYFDKNNKPFTVFLLCTEEELKHMKEKSIDYKIDFTKLNIIYKIKGHHVSEKLIKDLKDYSVVFETLYSPIL